MSRRTLLYSLALLYVILLSALPLINDLKTVNSWVGYGWGDYRYTNERINIVYEGVSIDSDRLKIEVRPPHPFSKYLTALTLSKLEVQPSNSSGVIPLMIKSLSTSSKETLLATYEGMNGKVYELVKAGGSGVINAVILCDKNYNIAILLKHYYFTYVKASNGWEGSSQEFYITYGFKPSDKLFNYALGNISISPVPTRISILHDGRGAYAIKVFFSNSRKVNITIHKILWLRKEGADPHPTIFEWILTARTAHASYIIIALLISALWWRRWMKEGR